MKKPNNDHNDLNDNNNCNENCIVHYGFYENFKSFQEVRTGVYVPNYV
jgi:hypothetical protein